jgi:putative selenate reductase molybdopterin-binding subunit
MSTYALLQTNQSPSNDEIAEALSGNICRCSEYPQIYESVRAAAAEMRGEQTITMTGGVDSSGGELVDPSLAE